MAIVRPAVWCISKIPILKWLQLICFFVVIIFINDGRYQWFIYTAIFFISIILTVVTFLTLVVQYVGVKDLYNTEIIFNLISFIICVLAGTILTYDLIKMTTDTFTHHQYLPPVHIGRQGWKSRIAVCTVFMLLNTLFYQASFVIIKHKGRNLNE